MPTVKGCNLVAYTPQGAGKEIKAGLLILCQLADGEMSVGNLQDIVGLSQSVLSQHLAVLREKGIVSTRREAQTIFYSLASGEAAAVIKTLYQQFCDHENC